MHHPKHVARDFYPAQQLLLVLKEENPKVNKVIQGSKAGNYL